jgi:hypothetical protein
MKEKRKFSRLSCILDGNFDKGNIWSQNRKLIIKDISGEGVSFISHDCLSKNEVLNFSLSFPELSKPISCAGKVVWVRKFDIGKTVSKERFEVGLKFVNVDLENRKRIDKLLQIIGKCKK